MFKRSPLTYMSFQSSITLGAWNCCKVTKLRLIDKNYCLLIVENSLPLINQG
jgi:hypothetical protein